MQESGNDEKSYIWFDKLRQVSEAWITALLPCLVRRAAFLKAGLEDDTENGYCVESLKGSDSQDVAAAAMACIEVQNHGVDRFVKSALSFCDSTERNGYLGVVSRGLEEIRILLMEHGVL